MNYRHAFHAGNFADVFKHVVLTRVLLYLGRKPAPFRMIDTHAGSGSHDLGGAQAARTQEWRDGVGRVDPARMSAKARALIQPYIDLVGPAARGEAAYPGSPALALALTRPFDRMTFCELHPQAFAALEAYVGRDKRAKALALDGYQGLNAAIPPIERRGVVLIDPPFEVEEEFDRLTAALLAAHRKWREGIILAWHPIKDRRGCERLVSALAAAEVGNVLRLELQVDHPGASPRLVSNGLVVINPPYTLEAEMTCLLPELAAQLAIGEGLARVHALSRA